MCGPGGVAFHHSAGKPRSPPYVYVDSYRLDFRVYIHTQKKRLHIASYIQWYAGIRKILFFCFVWYMRWNTVHCIMKKSYSVTDTTKYCLFLFRSLLGRVFCLKKQIDKFCTFRVSSQNNFVVVVQEICVFLSCSHAHAEKAWCIWMDHHHCFNGFEWYVCVISDYNVLS